MKSHVGSQWNSLVGKSTCHQALWAEFHGGRKELTAVSCSLTSTYALQHLWTYAQTYTKNKVMFLRYYCYSRGNDSFLKLLQWFDSIRQRDWRGLGVEIKPVLIPMGSYYMQFVYIGQKIVIPIYGTWEESDIFGGLSQEELKYWENFKPSEHVMYIHKNDIPLCWIKHGTEGLKHERMLLEVLSNHLNHL